LGSYGKSWGSRVPGWAVAVGLLGKDYHSFMAVVGAELKSRQMEYRFGDGTVEATAAPDTRWDIELRDLAGRCAERPRDEWDRLIADHLDAAVHSRA
jgi:hypothetical protein